jgi:ribonuclease HI
MESAQITIYTDGACEPNPGSAGCGFAVYRNGILTELLYGLYHQGTSNTAELNALYHALQLAAEERGNVRIFSDSLYSINCITKWAFKWKLKGWQKKGGPIKNLDIIQDAFELFPQINHRVEICHVRGHSGAEGNELADRMAVQAIDQQCSDMRVYEALDVDSILAMKTG